VGLSDLKSEGKLIQVTNILLIKELKDLISQNMGRNEILKKGFDVLHIGKIQR
jgi:hypothetical protein